MSTLDRSPDGDHDDVQAGHRLSIHGELIGLLVADNAGSDTAFLGELIGAVESDEQRQMVIMPHVSNLQHRQVLEGIAEALKKDGYQGVISLESVYRPDGGTFEDGFRECLPWGSGGYRGGQ